MSRFAEGAQPAMVVQATSSTAVRLEDPTRKSESSMWTDRIGSLARVHVSYLPRFSEYLRRSE